MKLLDKMKTEPKKIDCEKELDKMFFIKMGKLKGFAKPIWDWEKPKLVNLINALLTQQRTKLLKLVNKAFEETVIESEGHEYGFYEKLNNLLNKKDDR